MANTYVDYTATAGQTDFAFSFPYLEDEHIQVLIDGVETSNFTISLSPATKVVLNTGATSGQVVRVRRNSDPTVNLVDFVNGSVLTESDLDRAYQHNRYLNEEAFEGNTSSLQVLEGTTNFNANFNKIVNLAPPTASLDAANKDYVDDKLALSGTSLSGFNKSSHTGDGTSDQFNLSFTPQTGTAAAFRVAIDGVLQTPDVAYTVDSGASTITFTSAPPVNAEIVVVATGTAQDVNSVGVTATGSTTARTFADRFADVVNVKDFGAKGDGTTDDTIAIQAAVDSITSLGGTIYIPPGDYLITSTITVNNCSLVGDDAHQATKIIYNVTDGSAAFEVDGYYNRGFLTSFKNLYFSGGYTHGSGLDCVAIYLHNDTAEDVDAFVDRCFFSGFNKSIHIKGRGLTVTDSTFYQTLHAFYLDRVTPVNEGSGDDQKETSGFRVFQFYNNRFHGMGSDGSCISNLGTQDDNIRGIHFEGNYIDTSARIMTGPCRESAFVDNTHIYASNAASDPAVQTLFYAATGDYRLVNITGNTITGWSNPNARFNKHIIQTVAGGLFQCNISGNTFSHVKNEVIKIGTHIYDSIITNNNFSEICKEADSSLTRPIVISGDCYRNTISHNIFGVPSTVLGSNLDYLIHISGSQSNNTFAGNNYNGTLFEHVANAQGSLIVGGGLYIGGSSSDYYMNSYQSGSWTPTLTQGTSVTYNSQSGRYLKIGGLVHITAEIDISNSDTSDTSALHLSGLPFTSSANQQNALTFNLGSRSSFLGTKSTAVIGASIGASASSILLYEGDNNFILFSEIASSGLLYYSAIYETDE